MGIKKSYPDPNKKVDSSSYNIGCLNFITVGYLKSVADANAVQIDMCLKPEGIRVNFTKKLQDNSVRKRSVEITNSETPMFMSKISAAFMEVTGMMFQPQMMMPPGC